MKTTLLLLHLLFLFVHSSRKTPPPTLPPLSCLYSPQSFLPQSPSLSSFTNCSFPFLLPPFSSLLLDFGQTLAGNLSLNLSFPNGPYGRLVVGFSESIYTLEDKGDALSQHPLNEPDYYPSEIQLNGSQNVESGFSGAFRFAWIRTYGEVRVENVIGNVQLALNTPRDKNYRGFLETDDELVNEIWATGVFTQEICTGGVFSSKRQFIDGGKRDRALWSADSFVQLLVTLYSNYDLEGFRNTMESFADAQDESGYIPHMLPVLGEEVKIALNLAGKLTFTEYQCWFIVQIWEYFYFTGDLVWLRKMESSISKAAEWLRGKRGDDGMIDLSYGIGGFFGDGSSWHTPDATTGTVTHVNSLLAQTIDKYTKILSILDLPISSDWQTWHSTLLISINAKLWDSSRGVYLSTNPSFLHPDNIVHDAQIISILSDVADEGKKKSILSYSESHLHRDYGILTTEEEISWPPSFFMFPFMSKYISPYYSFMELYARLEKTTCDQSCGEFIVNRIKKWWGHMINKVEDGYSTTFWEKIDENGEPEAYHQTKMPVSYTSLAHGWSAGPVYLLSRIILGVKPLSPGFEKFVINPMFGVSGLRYAEGYTPTPIGDIWVKWSVNSVDDWMVEVGRVSGEGKIRLPDGREEEVGGGGRRWRMMGSRKMMVEIN